MEKPRLTKTLRPIWRKTGCGTWMKARPGRLGDGGPMWRFKEVGAGEAGSLIGRCKFICRWWSQSDGEHPCRQDQALGNLQLEVRRQFKANRDVGVPWKGQLLKLDATAGFSIETGKEKNKDWTAQKSTCDGKCELASFSRRKKREWRKRRNRHTCGAVVGRAVSLEARKGRSSWRTVAQFSFPLGMMQPNGLWGSGKLKISVTEVIVHRGWHCLHSDPDAASSSLWNLGQLHITLFPRLPFCKSRQWATSLFVWLLCGSNAFTPGKGRVWRLAQSKPHSMYVGYIYVVAVLEQSGKSWAWTQRRATSKVVAKWFSCDRLRLVSHQF